LNGSGGSRILFVWNGGAAMSRNRIICLVVSLVISFVVIFALAGGLAPGFSASTLGQLVLGATAAIIGLVLANIAEKRFFPTA
jgi:hypothetical protein